jgi:hypothetical protein
MHLAHGGLLEALAHFDPAADGQQVGLGGSVWIPAEQEQHLAVAVDGRTRTEGSPHSRHASFLSFTLMPRLRRLYR